MKSKFYLTDETIILLKNVLKDMPMDFTGKMFDEKLKEHSFDPANIGNTKSMFLLMSDVHQISRSKWAKKRTEPCIAWDAENQAIDLLKSLDYKILKKSFVEI